MRTVDTRTGIEWLDRDECLRLLAGDEVGRLAVVEGRMPVVFPVNYALDGDTIVIRTDAGTKLGAAGRAPACFEVDCLDRSTPHGLERAGDRSPGGGHPVGHRPVPTGDGPARRTVGRRRQGPLAAAGARPDHGPTRRGSRLRSPNYVSNLLAKLGMSRRRRGPFRSAAAVVVRRAREGPRRRPGRAHRPPARCRCPRRRG